MTKPAALRATYSDLKLIKTRQCVQIVFEVPLADFDAAYEVLGGMPNTANERWFGIAALKEVQTPGQIAPSPDRAKRDWPDLQPSQQAGIRCSEPIFAAFLRETYSDEWFEGSQDAAECVRLICAVESRSMLNDGPFRVIWHQLDEQYQAWKVAEHA